MFLFASANSVGQASLGIMNEEWRDYPCDEWQGRRWPDGYGKVGSNQQAHRLEWTLKRGPIPDGMLVLHHCDNRPCREIHHLFLGTHADNARDREAKGRSQAGIERRRMRANGTWWLR